MEKIKVKVGSDTTVHTSKPRSTTIPKFGGFEVYKKFHRTVEDLDAYMRNSRYKNSRVQPAEGATVHMRLADILPSQALSATDANRYILALCISDNLDFRYFNSEEELNNEKALRGYIS